MANVQPTGEVTVGVDRTGKHYMYEKGKGAGRQPLNLPDEVSQSLTAAGMSPGNPLHISGAQAQQLQSYKTNVGKGKPVEDLKSLGKYFKGQNAWVQGQGDPNQRLDLLASEDRMKVLRGPKSKEGQVVSAMVMSTILGREVGGGASFGLGDPGDDEALHGRSPFSGSRPRRRRRPRRTRRPWAPAPPSRRRRGRGLGRTLVDTVIAFARGAGYRLLRLWTNDVLVSARRIYQATDFKLVSEEKHHSFGKDLVGQIWERTL